MVRPTKPVNHPMLHGATTKIGAEIGQGNTNKVRKAILTSSNGRRRRLATKEFVAWSVFQKEKVLINYQKTWLELLNHGLPVAEYSKLDLRKNSPTYLHTFVPNLKKRYGKLIQVHDSDSFSSTRGYPIFLQKLNMKTDSKLIGELACDLAKIHSLRYATPWIDFWHFYKKRNSYERLILDVGELHKLQKSEPPTLSNLLILSSFDYVEKCFQTEEFTHFLKEYIRHTPSKVLAEILFDRYYPKPRGYYAQNAPKRKERIKRAILAELGK